MVKKFKHSISNVAWFCAQGLAMLGGIITYYLLLDLGIRNWLAVCLALGTTGFIAGFSLYIYDKIKEKK
ncbi:hypothetical protein NX86_02400 [Streptococcus phocae subsp. salmonis]|nr:hypothetical protein NX86_02400 [Streptococcus phocae subsp. salmonis]